MKKQKETKTVLLPLADGTKKRMLRANIEEVGIAYVDKVGSSNHIVYVKYSGKIYRLALSIDAAACLIYGENYDKS